MCPNNQSRTESEVAIMLHSSLCSTRYTAVQTNNSVRNFSAMNPCRFRKSSGKPFHAIANRHLALSAKRTGTKEDKGNTMMLLCGYCSWGKGMSRDEAMSSSEEIKPVALSIVEGFRVNQKTFLGLAMPNQYCCIGNVRLVFGLYCWAENPKPP